MIRVQSVFRPRALADAADFIAREWRRQGYEVAPQTDPPAGGDRPRRRALRPLYFTRDMGSDVYARAARARGDDIRLMISLETIGYYSEAAGSQHYVSTTGRWPASRLRELKRAVLGGAPDDLPFRVWWREGAAMRETHVPLGRLSEQLLSVTPGQKIGYVVDTVYHAENARRIVDLVRGADVLFIEAPFLQDDVDLAARKFHLTARQAGLMAREAEDAFAS